MEQGDFSIDLLLTPNSQRQLAAFARHPCEAVPAAAGGSQLAPARGRLIELKSANSPPHTYRLNTATERIELGTGNRVCLNALVSRWITLVGLAAGGPKHLT